MVKKIISINWDIGDTIGATDTGQPANTAIMKYKSSSQDFTRSTKNISYQGGIVTITFNFVDTDFPGAMQIGKVGALFTIDKNDLSAGHHTWYFNGSFQHGPPTYLEELAKLDQYSKAQYIP